nr:hypothetical protein [Candidatus Sigynarchaeota archaeon]
DQIQAVPQDLKKQVQGFIEQLTKQLATPGITSFQATVNQREMQLVEFLWEDLLALRKSKIQAAASTNLKVAGGNLLDFEQNYHATLVAATLAYSDNVTVTPQVQTRQIDLFNCIFVRFTQEHDAILDPEVREHGPFKKEDVAYLPRKMAELLVADGKAQRITVS